MIGPVREGDGPSGPVVRLGRLALIAAMFARMVAPDIRTIVRTSNVEYLDVWPAMLNEQGEPREEIFGEDGLHLNEDGYKIWTALVMPLVVKND